MKYEVKLEQAIKRNNRYEIEQIFENIYNDYYKLVAFIIYKYVKKKEDVQDLTSDCFLKFYRSIFKAKTSNIKALLVKIAKNSAIDFLRKSKDIVTYDETLLSNQPLSNDGMYEEIILSMEEVLNDDEINIISLHSVYEHTFNEISTILNRPVSTVKSIYRRAIQKYKKRL